MNTARVWVIQKWLSLPVEDCSDWSILSERVFTAGGVDSSALMAGRSRRECETWLDAKARNSTAQWRLFNRETQDAVPW